jgi:hypothetical protein
MIEHTLSSLEEIRGFIFLFIASFFDFIIFAGRKSFLVVWLSSSKPEQSFMVVSVLFFLGIFTPKICLKDEPKSSKRSRVSS